MPITYAMLLMEKYNQDQKDKKKAYDKLNKKGNR